MAAASMFRRKVINFFIYVDRVKVEVNQPFIAKYGTRYISSSCISRNVDEKPKNLLDVYKENLVLVGIPRYPKKKLIPFEEHLKFERKPISNIKIELKKSEWKPLTKRVGAIGIKLGMSSLWMKDGTRVAVSLVQIKECEIICCKIGREDGGNKDVTQVQIGGINKTDLSDVDEKTFEYFVQRGAPVKEKLNSFRVNLDGLIPAGTPINAMHFVPDQLLTIQGRSIDKGFQGVMKRWGMKGQPASHGQTKTHRKMGATGGGTNPGRVFPGKKMPGQMGDKRVTFTDLKVLRINTKYNVLYIKGSIPGPTGGIVRIQDTLSKAEEPILPYPTYIQEDSDNNELSENLYSKLVHRPDENSIEFVGVEIESRRAKGKGR